LIFCSQLQGIFDPHRAFDILIARSWIHLRSELMAMKHPPLAGTYPN
jgi:hypothetical protein